MRLAALLLSSVVGIAPAPGHPPVEERKPRARLPRDTEVPLRIKQAVSSAESKINDRVDFEVVDHVRQDDAIVIPRGSLAWGIVTAAEPKNRMRKNGKLDIDLQAICLPDGTGAPLRAVRRGSLTTPNSETAAGDSVLALPALPMLLFLYGKDVVIPKGREFTAFLDEDIEVERTALSRGPARGCASPEEAAQERALARIDEPPRSTILVRSKPDNAEIVVNGRFMGNTPATLRLQPGEHRIRLLQPGKVAWERVVVATPGGDSTIQATLESAVVVKR
jgi:hypothetical protein